LAALTTASVGCSDGVGRLLSDVALEEDEPGRSDPDF
jgi:hypothetical protein